MFWDGGSNCLKMIVLGFNFSVCIAFSGGGGGPVSGGLYRKIEMLRKRIARAHAHARIILFIIYFYLTRLLLLINIL